MKLIYLILALALYANPAHAYKFATGSFTGNVTDDRTIDISDTSSPAVADFQPEAVIVKCNSANHAMFRNASMASNEALQMALGNAAMVGNTIQSFSSVGFVVGSDSRSNASGVLCYYAAWAGDTNADMAVGTYVGDGADDRTIDISSTSFGSIADFQPAFCLVTEQTAGTADAGSWRSSNFSTNSSANFSASAFDANVIQTFNATGPEVGTSGLANETSSNYYYLCFKNVSGYTASGNYTGNGTSQSITGLGFQPQLIFGKGNSSTTAAGFRTAAMSGDLTCRIDGNTCGTGRVTSIDSDGFSVGSSTTMNESAVDIQWFAIKAPVYGKRISPIIIQ